MSAARPAAAGESGPPALPLHGERCSLAEHFDHHFTRVRAVDSSLRRAQHVGALHTSIPPSQFYLWLLYMRQNFPEKHV